MYSPVTISFNKRTEISAVDFSDYDSFYSRIGVFTGMHLDKMISTPKDGIRKGHSTSEKMMEQHNISFTKGNMTRMIIVAGWWSIFALFFFVSASLLLVVSIISYMFVSVSTPELPVLQRTGDYGNMSHVDSTTFDITSRHPSLQGMNPRDVSANFTI